MAADWRRHNSDINIQPDTKIPEITVKLCEPDDAAYHRNQIEIDERIDELNKDFSEAQIKYGETSQEMKGGQAGKGGVSKELKGHFDELKKWNDKKRDIFAKREELDQEIGRIN